MRGTAAHSFFRRLLSRRALALIPLAGAVAVGAAFLHGAVQPGKAEGAGAPLPAVVLHESDSTGTSSRSASHHAHARTNTSRRTNRGSRPTAPPAWLAAATSDSARTSGSSGTSDNTYTRSGLGS